MNDHEHDIDIFDNYLDGNLSKEERLDFEHRLLSDDNFSKSFNDYKSDINLISLSHDQFILTEITNAEQRFSKKRRYIISFIIIGLVLLTGTLLLFLTNKESPTKPIATTFNESISVTKDLPPISIDTSIIPKSIPPTYNSEPIEKLKIESDKEDSVNTAQYPETEPLRYKILHRHNKTTISKKSDTITIRCPKGIKSIIPFSKNGKEYLLLNRTLYILNNSIYTYTSDNRPADLIQKSTGLGKKYTFEIEYFNLNKEEFANLTKTYLILDSDTLSTKQIINRRIKLFKTINIPTRFFTSMDIITLNNSN